MNKKLLALVISSLLTSQVSAVTVFDDGTNKASIGGFIGMAYHNKDSKTDSADTIAKDGDSRINFGFESKLEEGVTAYAKAEWGFWGDQRGKDNNGTDDKVFYNRLGYVGMKGDFGSLTFGKQWATYNKIASWADKMAKFSGDAIGVYDGYSVAESLGTSRADDALQYNISMNGLNFSAQYQTGGRAADRSGLTRETDNSYAAALSYDFDFGLGLGVSHNNASFIQSNAKDATATAVAIRFRKDAFYTAATYVKTENQWSTAANETIKATGYELFAGYQVTDKVEIQANYQKAYEEFEWR